MAGGKMKYRTLSRTSAHRQALLRNLVTSLVRNETIHTTWHKAKEAQRLAEKLITLAKRDNEETRRKAQAILFSPDILMPKLFNELKTRYATRTGGYTRVLLTEPKKDDQARSAILELIDGPRDMRFAMTAAALARDRQLGRKPNALTLKNAKKVVQFRPNGRADLEAMIQKTSQLNLGFRQGMADAEADGEEREGEVEEQGASKGKKSASGKKGFGSRSARTSMKRIRTSSKFSGKAKARMAGR